ncbi:MAG: MerR family DNA-binding transcriptional regulator [Micromonosporaceae bacterium]|nr:MerR family DNA-binding transcriptional regulator [Micromonosporaceae bacterium]
MTQSGASSAAASSNAAMSIGEVLAHLRAEFPDTTISKLRFLESEGLVDPQRTAAGYRKYTWDDVARLRFVLTAQRDHYLPLRVIREQLESLDRGEQPSGLSGYGPSLTVVDRLPTAEDFSAPAAEVRFSWAELAQQAGVSEEELRGLEQYGLIGERPGGFYDGTALEVAKVARDLSRFGVEPRHLRAFRAGADREIGLFAQVVAPLVRQSSPEAQARAEEVVRELAALSLRLHTVLVQAGLRDTLRG